VLARFLHAIVHCDENHQTKVQIEIIYIYIERERERERERRRRSTFRVTGPLLPVRI